MIGSQYLTKGRCWLPVTAIAPPRRPCLWFALLSNSRIMVDILRDAGRLWARLPKTIVVCCGVAGASSFVLRGHLAWMSVTDVRECKLPLVVASIVAILSTCRLCDYVSGWMKVKDRDVVRCLMTAERNRQYKEKCKFWNGASIRFAAFVFNAIAVLLLVGIVTERIRIMVIHVVVLLYVNLAVDAISSSFIEYDIDSVIIPVKNALGYNYVEDVTRRLGCICDDISRFQYLPHDLLRSRHHYDIDRGMLLGEFPGIRRVPDPRFHRALPLHLACMSSSLKNVQYLLVNESGDEEPLTELRDERGNTALHYACLGGNWKVVEYLLDNYAHLVTERNIHGEYPFYLCGENPNGAVCNCSYDPEGTKLLETTWRVLLAHPEAVASIVRAKHRPSN